MWQLKLLWPARKQIFLTNIWPFTTNTTENLLFCYFSKIVIVTSSAKISPREIFKNASSAKISPHEMLEFCG